MPGCPNGADASALGKGTQQILDIAALTGALANLLNKSAKTAVAGYAASLVDIDALCELNPDPPRPLEVKDFVAGVSYVGGQLLTTEQLITRYIYEWLRYEMFTRMCVCRVPVLDPALNCIHATNVVIPPTLGGLVQLGAVVIQPEVYDSWQLAGLNQWNVWRSASSTTSGGAVPGHDWDLEVLDNFGTWIALDSDDTIPESSTSSNRMLPINGFQRFPRSPSCRLRNVSARATTLTRLDYCFIPTPAVPTPIPPQPDIPSLPTLPTPTCSTDDLCAIVKELARQLTRVSGQVADIQATLTSTDQLETIASFPISGEGERVLALGTRAVSVELTHLGPGVFTSALGRPRGLMRAGSVRWGDGTGYSEREFVDAEDFTRLRPQGALSISWQLINECSGTLRFLG